MTPRPQPRRVASSARGPADRQSRMTDVPLARMAGGMVALILLAGCGSSTGAGGGPDATTDGGTMTTPDSGPTVPDDDGTSTGPSAGTVDTGDTADTAEPGDPDDAGRTALGPGAVLAPQDDGATVQLAPGEEVSLQLAPPWDVAEPTSDDPSVVEVVPVDHFADPGYSEFGLLALAPGTVSVLVVGQGEEFAVHVHVTD